MNSTDHITERRARQSAARARRALGANEPDKLCALKAERDELRSVLAQCVRRLEALNTGGPDEPDPTMEKARAVLAKGKA